MPQPKKYESAAARTAAWRQRTAQPKPAPAHYSALKPGYRRWDLMAEEARELLQTIADERAEYYDDRSEEWQESDRAEAFTEKTDAIQEIIDALEQLES